MMSKKMNPYATAKKMSKGGPVKTKDAPKKGAAKKMAPKKMARGGAVRGQPKGLAKSSCK